VKPDRYMEGQWREVAGRKRAKKAAIQFTIFVPIKAQ
jgi:hypothetical protein